MTQIDTYVMYVPYETCMISKPKSCYILKTSNKLNGSVAYRYRKSISIIELFVSIYIGFLATNF